MLHSRIFLSVLALIVLITGLALSQKTRTVKAESNISAEAAQKLARKAACRKAYLEAKKDLRPIVRPDPPRPVSQFGVGYKLPTLRSLSLRPLTPLGMLDDPGEPEPGGYEGCKYPCRRQALTCGSYWLCNLNNDGCTFVCTTGSGCTGVPSVPYMCDPILD